MSLRKELADVLTVDARYSLDAYAFVLESLEHAKSLRKREQILSKPASKGSPVSKHVNGRELCEAARHLASQLYGYMALGVLKHWGISSTYDIGEIVFHMIASGILKKAAGDTRNDFLDVFDFEQAFRLEFSLSSHDLDEITGSERTNDRG